MFYLESRGINSKDATRILMEGFLIGNGNKKENVVKEFIDKLKEVQNG